MRNNQRLFAYMDTNYIILHKGYSSLRRIRMKIKLYLILLGLFFISCDSEIPVYTTDPNPNNGHWTINTTEDLEGAATIIVNSVGSVHNGIKMKFYDLADVIVYIDGTVNKDGTLHADFYCNYTSQDPVLAIVSSTGIFNGTFTGSAAGGNYSLTLLNGDVFNGSWQGVRQ